MNGGGVVLVDTGPLVALFDPSDGDHERCKEALAGLRRARLLTSLAVVTEVTYLLGFSSNAQQAFMTFLNAAISIEDIGPADLSRAAALMAKFANLPMDFADATLVVLAERLQTTRVFTLDRRDFSAYRVGRRAFRIIPA